MKQKHKPDISKVKYLNFEIEKKAMTKDADGRLYIEGYANTVDKDRVNDVVLPEAFEETLKTYLQNPILLYQHNWDIPIGRVVDIRIDDKGLWIKAFISNASDCEDYRIKIREGILKTLSIGYNEQDADLNPSSKTNVIKKLELLEVSVVTIPANPNATFQPAEDIVQESTETASKGAQKNVEQGGKTGMITSFSDEQKEFEGCIPKSISIKVKPNQGESESDYIARSIPILMDEGYPQEQAIAIAYSMWGEEKGGEGSGGARAGAGRKPGSGIREIGADEPEYNSPDKPKPSDTLKQPVIGRLTTKPFEMTVTSNGETKPITLPASAGDVIGKEELSDGSTIYILNSWYKPGVPQVVHSSMVESYNENEGEGKGGQGSGGAREGAGRKPGSGSKPSGTTRRVSESRALTLLGEEGHYTKDEINQITQNADDVADMAMEIEGELEDADYKEEFAAMATALNDADDAYRTELQAYMKNPNQNQAQKVEAALMGLRRQTDKVKEEIDKINQDNKVTTAPDSGSTNQKEGETDMKTKTDGQTPEAGASAPVAVDPAKLAEMVTALTERLAKLEEALKAMSEKAIPNKPNETEGSNPPAPPAEGEKPVGEMSDDEVEEELEKNLETLAGMENA